MIHLGLVVLQDVGLPLVKHFHVGLGDCPCICHLPGIKVQHGIAGNKFKASLLGSQEYLHALRPIVVFL